MTGTAADVTATTQVTTQAALLHGLVVVGGSDVAEYEVRDGAADVDPRVLRVKAPINDTRAVLFEAPVPVSQLRVVKVSGTASSATVYLT